MRYFEALAPLLCERDDALLFAIRASAMLFATAEKFELYDFVTARVEVAVAARHARVADARR